MVPLPLTWLVGGDADGVHPVGAPQLGATVPGGAGHAAESLVGAEEALEADRGERLIERADVEALLRFDRLVQARPPGPVGHEAAGGLVHDDDLAVLDDVLVALQVKVPGHQRLMQHLLPTPPPEV